MRRTLAGLLIILCNCPLLGETGQDPPVIIITLDTTRADRLGAYGYEAASTPNLDRFAEQSTVFEQAISPVPITLPAHCSLFTGTYPLFHGVRDFAGRLQAENVTLAEIFKDHGYRTAAFVSSEVLVSSFGIDQGFDFYDQRFEARPGSSEAERRAEQVTSDALRWIDENDGAPYFLWVHYFDPHDPYDPPEPFASRFSDRLYDGEIAYMDSQIGRLFDALPQESVVIVAGDHGESLGEHGEKYHGIFVYDATVRVPLLVRMPGIEPSRVQEQVKLIDIFPTLLNFLRWEPSGQVQGKSFLSLLLRRGSYQEDPAYVESFYSRIHMGWSELQGIRTTRHKFIRAPDEEFYDLKDDPGERNNLRNSNQALALQHRNELVQLTEKFSSSSTSPPNQQANLSSEQLERLKSLGYVAFSGSDSGVEDSGFDKPDPKDKISLFNELTEALRMAEEDPQKSIRLLKQILSRDSHIAVAHFTLGQTHMKLEQYILAAEAFKQTLKLSPDYTEAVYNLALSYAHMGRLDDAVTGFERVIQLNSNHFRAYHQLAAAQLRLRQVQPAVENLETAIRLAPHFVQGRNDLARVYLYQKQYRAAVNQLKKILEIDPEFTPAYFNLGTAYLHMGEKDKAREAFVRAKELNPNLKIPAIP